MRSTTELRQHFLRKPGAYDGAALALSTRLAARTRWRHVRDMSGKDKQREERLAAALRQNLRRRKAQDRAKSVSAEEGKEPE
jgi:hypothetical protein